MREREECHVRQWNRQMGNSNHCHGNVSILYVKNTFYLGIIYIPYNSSFQTKLSDIYYIYNPVQTAPLSHPIFISHKQTPLTSCYQFWFHSHSGYSRKVLEIPPGNSKIPAWPKEQTLANYEQSFCKRRLEERRLAINCVFYLLVLGCLGRRLY